MIRSCYHHQWEVSNLILKHLCLRFGLSQWIYFALNFTGIAWISASVMFVLCHFSACLIWWNWCTGMTYKSHLCNHESAQGLLDDTSLLILPQTISDCCTKQLQRAEYTCGHLIQTRTGSKRIGWINVFPALRNCCPRSAALTRTPRVFHGCRNRPGLARQGCPRPRPTRAHAQLLVLTRLTEPHHQHRAADLL
jgi:hypothetical protein